MLRPAAVAATAAAAAAAARRRPRRRQQTPTRSGVKWRPRDGVHPPGRLLNDSSRCRPVGHLPTSPLPTSRRRGRASAIPLTPTEPCRLHQQRHRHLRHRRRLVVVHRVGGRVGGRGRRPRAGLSAAASQRRQERGKCAYPPARRAQRLNARRNHRQGSPTAPTARLASVNPSATHSCDHHPRRGRRREGSTAVKLRMRPPQGLPGQRGAPRMRGRDRRGPDGSRA